MKLIWALLFCAGVCVASEGAPETVGVIDVVPGKALGEVKIGETKDALTARGFKVEPDSGQIVKAPLHASLNDGHVSEIWVTDVTAVSDRMRLDGRKFPARISLKTLGPFFGDCERPVKGSGGLLMFCKKRGVQIATSFGRKEINFSVVKN